MKILKYAFLSFLLSAFGFVFVALSAQLFGGVVTDTQIILYSVHFVSAIVIFCTMLIIDAIKKHSAVIPQEPGFKEELTPSKTIQL